jgi:hypothetical protein
MRRLALLSLLALASCRDDVPPPPLMVVEPPVASPDAVPDAPVSGRIRGAAFVMRDARYRIDRRPGYAHTDIELSSGAAESACAAVLPRTSTSVWLRLEGVDPIASASTRSGPGGQGPWKVYYQAYQGAGWVGVGEGSALVTLHEPGPDGHVPGGIAVCFPDETKSCVSGSFDAVACPASIDQPVRGTPPPEAIPPAYLTRVLEAGPP